MIKELFTEKELLISVEIIRSSFKTVRDKFNLTRDNCPTHPSFITYDDLLILKNKGLNFFGFFEKNLQIGFVATEKAGKDAYYIEKLAVLPDYRRRGHGKSLMLFAMDYVKKSDGRTISIGVINEDSLLKNWYMELGFKETTTKKFSHLPFTVCFMEMKI